MVEVNIDYKIDEFKIVCSIVAVQRVKPNALDRELTIHQIAVIKNEIRLAIRDKYINAYN